VDVVAVPGDGGLRFFFGCFVAVVAAPLAAASLLVGATVLAAAVVSLGS
jgi:hypothetical protein